MKPIDVSALAEPISADDPAGPYLEYDPDFVALKDAVRVEPEQQFGDTIIEEKGPDWASVRDLAGGILTRSKDLEAAIYLVQALVHGNGLSGLAQGLALIRALLETFWDSLHPQLDPEDDLDPTERVNFIANLCDADLVLTPIRLAPIAQIPGLGGISLRDVEIAKGQAPAPHEGETLKLESIEAAIRDVDRSVVETAASLVENAIGDLSAIEQALMEKVGVTHSVSLEALSGTLREIKEFLNEQLGTSDDTGKVETDEGGDAGNGVSTHGNKRRVSGEITCSQDVVRTLDMIISYYEANEPSSPVPLLLQRAKRLISVDFMEILRDIAPDALAQAEQVTGASSETNE